MLYKSFILRNSISRVNQQRLDNEQRISTDLSNINQYLLDDKQKPGINGVHYMSARTLGRLFCDTIQIQYGLIFRRRYISGLAGTISEAQPCCRSHTKSIKDTQVSPYRWLSGYLKGFTGNFSLRLQFVMDCSENSCIT